MPARKWNHRRMSMAASLPVMVGMTTALATAIRECIDSPSHILSIRPGTTRDSGFPYCGTVPPDGEDGNVPRPETAPRPANRGKSALQLCCLSIVSSSEGNLSIEKQPGSPYGTHIWPAEAKSLLLTALSPLVP